MAGGKTSPKLTADSPVSALSGVGPALAKTLEKLDIFLLQDLWFHLPLRYENRTAITPMSELVAGESAQIEGKVVAVERGFRFKPQLRVVLEDDTQTCVVLRFFHFQKSQVDGFVVGARFRCFGDVRESHQGMEIVHPTYRRVGENEPVDEELTPIYPTVAGLGQVRLRKLVQAALQVLPESHQIELLPAELRKQFALPELARSLRFVHTPNAQSNIELLIAGQHPAQKRLAFEELLAHQLSMRRMRALARSLPAVKIANAGARRTKLLKSLPFSLTKAQQKVLKQLDADLASGVPMLRLVQGDVGSGKTIVAALSALSVIDAGLQVALAAPTEILAEQHLRNFKHWLEPLGVNVVWLAGKVLGKARQAALAAVADDADMVIGTHALMTENVSFRALGLSIIDEQHRFGVDQRLALREKGRLGKFVSHQMLTTATPIPRTLAMAAYADLDVSAIDELPPGRVPVTTVAIAQNRRDEIVQRIQVACAQGSQAYWVCPLVEESDLLNAQAAEATFEMLQQALPKLNVGLIHGRMKAKQKREVMDEFLRAKIQVLVATTVIEVGVDVANASVMVIENAERMGLSQLHQLRGRVGRGVAQSSCVLMYQTPLSDMAKQRIGVMRETNDGFKIAEKDLELRGPGELLGTKQTGRVTFRVADLARDAHELPRVAEAAQMLMSADAELVERIVKRWIGSAARYAQA